QTIGKKIVGIRVIGQVDRGNPSFISALTRNVLRYVDYIPYLFPIIGVVLILATKKRQRLGDLVAKTYVVRSPNLAEDS
ncbi:MAG: RDD family protein, partial [Nitrosopumilus sp.]